MFTELFEKAQRDGKLAADVDVRHLTRLAGTLVSEGARHWAAGTLRIALSQTLSETTSRP